LEAHFYNAAIAGAALDATLTTSGNGLTAAGALTDTGAPVAGNTPNLTPHVLATATTLRDNEVAHLTFLRTVLKADGKACPAIDISAAKFNTFFTAAAPAGFTGPYR